MKNQIKFLVRWQVLTLDSSINLHQLQYLSFFDTRSWRVCVCHVSSRPTYQGWLVVQRIVLWGIIFHISRCDWQFLWSFRDGPKKLENEMKKTREEKGNKIQTRQVGVENVWTMLSPHVYILMDFPMITISRLLYRTRTFFLLLLFV